jgi:hypothetical protein
MITFGFSKVCLDLVYLKFNQTIIFEYGKIVI